MNTNEKLIKRNNQSYTIISFSLGINLISTLAVQYLFKDYLVIEQLRWDLLKFCSKYRGLLN